ncbi:MAG: DUF342 domain-containing protein [Desulfobulbaceae bacterium]|nr:DUF342 domain-containing protein [Desulfobulbaceae bacterium]
MTKDTFIEIIISDDLIQVSLQSVCRITDKEHAPTEKNIQTLLNKRGIVHGIDEQAVARAAHLLAETGFLEEPITIASGSYPQPSQSGEFEANFASVSRTVNKDGEPQQITLSPFVRQGFLLGAVHDYSPPVDGMTVFGKQIKAAKITEVQILAGDHVAFTEDNRFLKATVSGYPQCLSGRDGKTRIITISMIPTVELSVDNMQATLFIEPPLEKKQHPDPETVMELLHEAEVIFGINKQAIKNCLDDAVALQEPRRMLVAQGLLPVHGQDATLQFEVEVGPLPGKIMSNGRIDFRERLMFVGVQEGQLIARKIPPTQGSPGKNVVGEEVSQKPGKDISIKVSDDASYSEETGDVHALRSGVLSMVSENTIKVCSKLLIADDVDYSTGNIISRDSVEIGNSVKPKFRVNALGDIHIGKNIETAWVRSDGNVVVQGGLTGDMATIRARGDVDIKFIEHGRIYAGGTIVLRKNAYYCRLIASGNLFCEDNARVIGSQLAAGGSISVGHAGSINSKPVFLAAATDPERLQKYFDLRRNVAEKEEAVNTWRQRYGQDAESDELDNLETEHKKSRELLSRLNMIPGTDEDEPEQGEELARESSIVVNGEILAGTLLRIGNTAMTLERTMAKIKFCLQYPESETDGSHAQLRITALP